jgi:hypothetical protein
MLIFALALTVLDGCGRLGFDSVGGGFRDERTVLFQNSGGEVLQNVPVMVGLRSDELKITDAAKLRFWDASDVARKSPLPFEIEQQQDEAASAVLWVLVPEVDASNSDYIVVSYDQAEAPSVDRTVEVWAGYQMVLHFAKRDVAPLNSAGISTNIRSLNVESAGDLGIGGSPALKMDGSTPIATWLTFPSDPNESSLTLSAWAHSNGQHKNLTFATNPTRQAIVGRRFKGGGSNDFLIGYESPVSDVQSATCLYEVQPRPVLVKECELNGTDLDMFAMVVDRTAVPRVSMYVNQTASNTFDIPAALSIDDEIVVGADADSGQQDPDIIMLNGYVDEVRVEKKIRTTGWIKAQYAIGRGAFHQYCTTGNLNCPGAVDE